MLVTLTLAGIVAAGTATIGAVTTIITKTKTPNVQVQHDDDGEKTSLKATVKDADDLGDSSEDDHCYCDHCDANDNNATFTEFFPSPPMYNHSVKDDDYYYHDTVRVIKELHESLEEAEARLASLEAKRSSTAGHRLNPSAAEFVPTFNAAPTAYDLSSCPSGRVSFPAPLPSMLANNSNGVRLATCSPFTYPGAGAFGDICFGCDDPAFLMPAPPSPIRGSYFGSMQAYPTNLSPATGSFGYHTGAV